MIRFDYGATGVLRVLTVTDGQLIVRPLNNNEEYTAVSHTWGSSRNTIPEVDWDVASWISHQVCESLVHKFGGIWIDSLCIVQNDENDKKHQIQNMHSIYANAKDVVVVLVDNFQMQIRALQQATQLLTNLCVAGECTSSNTCHYFRCLAKLRTAAIEIRDISWFRRVWTLQETIIPDNLVFVGFENNTLRTNVTTVDELSKFIHAFDVASDTKSNAWLGSLTHGCTKNTIDPLSVAKDVGNIADSIRPSHLQWYATMNGTDAVTTLEYTAETVFRQLGNGNRGCEKLHDIVYGVCALLEIDVTVDYERQFDELFIDAVTQLVKRSICVLPQQPRPVHGHTWLPSLEHVDPENVWRTVKSSCVLSEEDNMYHNIICKYNKVFAKGIFIQMHHPHTFRARLEHVKTILDAVVRSVKNKSCFCCNTDDQALIYIVYAVLWMYKNCGNDSNTKKLDLESLIYSVCNCTDLRTARMIDIVTPAIVRAMSCHGYNIPQMVNYILESCTLVPAGTSVYNNAPLHDRDVVLVCQKKIGVALYSTHLSVCTGSAYGIFYKQLKCSRVREITCNILASGDDGVWDNHGRATCWYITRSWDICKRMVPVGMIQ